MLESVKKNPQPSYDAMNELYSTKWIQQHISVYMQLQSTVFIYTKMSLKFQTYFFKQHLGKICLKYWSSSLRVYYLLFTLRKRSGNFNVCEQRFCEILLGYYMW